MALPTWAPIGIQVGGIGGLVPERRNEIAQLGFRAMLGGTIATLMTACIAGLMLYCRVPGFEACEFIKTRHVSEGKCRVIRHS